MHFPSGTSKKVCGSLEKEIGTNIHYKTLGRNNYPIHQNTTSGIQHGLKSISATDPTIYQNGIRNSQTYQNRCFRSLSQQNHFFIENVPCSKARRKCKTSPKLKAVKQIFETKAIQADKSFESSGVSTKGRFSDQAGSVKCLPTSSNKAGPSPVLSNILQRPVLPDDGITFRSFHGPANVHASNKLGRRDYEIPGNPHYSLSRRFPSGGSRLQATGTTSQKGDTVPGRLGLDHKLGEVRVNPSTNTGVSRNMLEHKRKCKILTSYKNKENKKAFEDYNQKKDLDVERSKVTLGKSGVRKLRGSSRPPSLPRHSNSREQVKHVAPKPKRTYPQESFSRTRMVDIKCGLPLKNLSPKPNCLYVDRRIRFGLGSKYGRNFNVGSMGTIPKDMAYQSERTVRRQGNDKEKYQNIEGSGTNGPIRQQNCPLLLAKAGRNKIQNTTEYDKRHLEYMPQNQHNNTPSICTRKVQFDSGQSLKKQACARMVPIEDNGSKDLFEMGHSTNRLIRLSSIGGSKKLRKFKLQRKNRSVHKCFQSNLEFQVGMDIPSANSDPSDLTTLEPSQRQIRSDSTQMGQNFLESGPAQESTSTAFSNKESSSSPARLDDSGTTTKCETIKIGGLEGSGWSNLVKDWSVEEITLLEGSWRKSSLNTYKAAWNRWRDWCKSKNLQCTSPTPQTLALFISYLHSDLALSVSTIRVHKSVVCTFADPSSSHILSSDVLVKRMLKSVQLQKPKSTCASKSIWDVAKLIDWLSQNPPDDENLYQLSRHVAFLLLLSTGRRVHDLTLLHLTREDMEISQDSLVFWPRFGSKTDSASYRQSGWEFKRNDSRNLCVPYWIDKLIGVSNDRRKANPSLSSLFITTRGVVKPASRCVIAGWMRSLLDQLGITDSAGSIRAAVASRNYELLPLDEVLRKGNWRSETTFFKHYFKTIKPVKTPVVTNSLSALFVAK